MDDFIFPAAAAAAAVVVVEDTPDQSSEYTLCLHHQGLLAFGPDRLASSSPPLWFAAAAPVAVSRAADDMGGHAHGLDDGELVRGAGAGEEGEEDKMDLLWENFNEELEALHRRAGSCSKASACGGWKEPWDTESERGRAGCAPMLMAASSRAGGAEHYRRTSSWLLFMRIFRSLFVVEKTIPAARRRRERSP